MSTKSDEELLGRSLTELLLITLGLGRLTTFHRRRIDANASKQIFS